MNNHNKDSVSASVPEIQGFNYFDQAPITLLVNDFSKTEKLMKTLNLDSVEAINTYYFNNDQRKLEFAETLNIIDANTKALSMYGANSKQELIENIHRVCTRRSLIDLTNLVLKLINGANIIEIETEHRNLDGTILPVLMKFQKLGQGNLFPEKIICAVENLTKLNREKVEQKVQKEALKISQELAQVSSWYYDFELDYFYWSDEVFNMLELDSKVELDFELLMKFVHPEDIQKVNNYSIEFYLDNPIQTMQYRIISSKGNLKYISEKRNVIIEDGRIIRVLGTGQDITSRIKAEQKVASSEKMVSRVFDNVNEGVFIIDEMGKYSYMNANAEKILGVSAKSLVGSDLWKGDCPKRDENFYQSYLNAKRENKTVRLEIYYKDTKKWFKELLVPAENQMLIFFNEITERKEADNKIEEAYNIINASSSVAILTEYSENFPVIFASENTIKLFGYTYQEFLNKELVIDDLIYPVDRERVSRDFQNYIRNGAQGTYSPDNYRVITKDDQIKWVKVSIEALKNEAGTITHIQGIFEDVTEFKLTADQLQESSRRLKFQFDNTPLAHIIWDVDCRITEWNASAERIFGFTAEEAIGKLATDLIVPENLEDEIKGVQDKILNDNGGNRNTNKNITKSGELIICDWYNVNIKNADGQIIGVASLAEDITSRIRAQEILEESEHKYRSIFERSVDGVLIIENEKVIDANSAILNLLRTDKENLLKKGVCAFSNQTQRKGQTALSKGLKKINITKKFGSSRFRWLCRRQDGTEFPAEITLTKIESSYENLRLQAVIRDISDRVKREQMEKVVFNISKAAHSISDIKEFGTFVKRELGKILDSRNLFFGLYNKKKARISIPIFLGSQDDNIMEFSAERSISGYVIRTNKPLFLTRSGIEKRIKAGTFDLIGTLPELWMGVPLRIRNEVIGAIVMQSYDNPYAYVPKDISILEFVSDQISRIIARKNDEQKLMNALEKAQESDRLKSSFLANMSHEIRTPMNGIIGFSELFLNDNISEEQRKKYAQIVAKSSKQLLSIVNDILDLSKIEAGAFQLSESKENLNKILNDIYSFSENTAKEKGLTLNLNCGLPEDKANVEIDGTKIQQVFTNLISNSFKFTEEGSVEIGYTLENNYLKFYVSDTGIGIARELQEKVFERFIQEEQTKLTQVKGTGLGLSICKKIIELFNGEIWLTSNSQGTTVYFTIPYKQVTEAMSSRKDTPIVNFPKEEMKEVTILVAEDEEFNMFYINELFANTNYRLIEAANGVEAVELARKNEGIDLILMDIKMPRLNGKEAMRQIKLFNSEVPIIALTAFAMESDKKDALDSGFDSFLTKPIDKDALFEKVEQYTKTS